MMGLMKTLLAKVPLSEIREGDIFCANDPYAAGGTHLPDVNLAMPVFADGRLISFVCNIAHHADIGGMAPGSMAGEHRDLPGRPAHPGRYACSARASSCRTCSISCS